MRAPEETTIYVPYNCPYLHYDFWLLLCFY